MIDPDTLPLWSPELPGGGRARAKGTALSRRHIVRPTITRRGRGVLHRLRRAPCSARAEAGPGVRESFEQICRRAGVTLTYPAGCRICAAERRGGPRA